MTQWNPDCQEPCDCPGEERADPIQLALFNPEPNDGPGPDGHHRVSGECFACLVGVATGPESHGIYCELAPPACTAHKLVQHRDRKPKWCDSCGRGANGQVIGGPRAFGRRAV